MMAIIGNNGYFSYTVVITAMADGIALRPITIEMTVG